MRRACSLWDASVFWSLTYLPCPLVTPSPLPRPREGHKLPFPSPSHCCAWKQRDLSGEASFTKEFQRADRAVASGRITAFWESPWRASDESKPQHMDTGTTAVSQGAGGDPQHSGCGLTWHTWTSDFSDGAHIKQAQAPGCDTTLVIKLQCGNFQRKKPAAASINVRGKQASCNLFCMCFRHFTLSSFLTKFLWCLLHEHVLNAKFSCTEHCLAASQMLPLPIEKGKINKLLIWDIYGATFYDG